MEASALQAPAGLARARISVGAPLLRLRSDEQLLALFRAGNDDAFRVIHDRYRSRLFAYTRQMLPGCKQDAEDALQDVFVRAYSGLRANRRQLALRPWLYRVAHNRCVDELRRPVPPAPEVLHQVGAPTHDPIVQAEQRESLRRLIADLRRLPDHQRSALLMRELGGMSYVDVAAAMDVSVPAVRSLLVRARIGLAQAVQARDTACIEIRDEMTLAHDRGVRASGTVRRHLADCDGCRHFRGQLRGSRRQFAALAPALGPMGVLAKMLGIGGGAAGGGAGAAATGGATATTGAAVGGGTVASAGTLAAGASHVATLIAAAVVTAGGAVAIQHTITPPVSQRHAVHALAGGASSTSPVVAPLPYQSQSSAAPANAPAASTAPGQPSAAKHAGATTSASASPSAGTTSISGGDNIVPTAAAPGETTDSGGTATAGTTPTTGTTTPTGTDGTGTNGAANSTGAGTATGTASSTGDPSTSGSGTTGTADTSPGDSSSSGSGDPTAPKTGAGTTTGATTGTTTGTTSGTTTGTTTGPPTGT